MQFFRSEEVLNNWLAQTGTPRGAVLTIPTLWALTQPWYTTRLNLDYHGRSLDAAQTLFRQVGLTDPFWYL